MRLLQELLPESPRRAQDEVRGLLQGRPEPAWGAIAAPAVAETLPPTDPPSQLTYLAALLDDMASLQPTTDADGGLVTTDAVSAIIRFVERAHASF